MNAHVSPEAQAEGAWSPPRQAPPTESPALLERWRAATQEALRVAAKHGWSKSEFARRADIPGGTFSGWFDGTYKGRYDTTTQRVENFLASCGEAAEAAASLPAEPGFVKTRTARELFEALTYAQHLPTVAVATVVSGCGKTTAAQAYARTRPHVFVVTLSPSSKRPHILLGEVAEQIGIETGNSSKLKGVLVRALRREGFSALLIIDEAQYLTEECINELRYLHDAARCGLVLLGNDEVTTPYATRDARHHSPQVARRVGHRLSILRPHAEDIDAYVDAWGLDEPELRAIAKVIAAKPGALGALAETIKAGSMIARGAGRGLTAADLKAAYVRRGQGAI